MHVPLTSKGRVIGTLNFGSQRAAQYDDRQLTVAQEIADHLAVLIEHTLLHEESREAAKLQERTRLAREIHDSVAQSLAALVVQLESAAELLSTDRESARADILSARALARETLEEARRAVWELQPLVLASSDLTAAIRGQAARVEREGLETSLRIVGDRPDSMDPRCESALLRIAQEGVSNVLRHSEARAVRINLCYDVAEAQVEIADDGKGFDPAAAADGLTQEGGGFGLTSMQERARLAGGQIEVHSAPGMGTRIDARIPYEVSSDVAPVAAGAIPAAPVPDAEEASAVRVLIVDDHEVARQGTRRMLESAPGIDVVGEAADGETAIERTRALQPDVILLDVQMPGMGGVEALRRIGELGLGTRVILFSVYSKDEGVFEGLRAGARGYLLKDVGRDDLVAGIRTVHAGGSLLPPVIASRLLARVDIRAGPDLTARELEVLRSLASGSPNKEIAAQLTLNVNTVKFHVRNIYQKLDVQTRTAAVRAANERGLLPD